METDNLKTFTFDLLQPTYNNFRNAKADGSRVILLGKPKSGKSTLIKCILMNKMFIPCGVVISGTESMNKFYEKIFPPVFIHEEYNEEIISKFLHRQTIVKQSLDPSEQWAVLIVDDCATDASIFKKPLQHTLFKNGRHFKMLYLLGLQYVFDMPPAIRSVIAGIFIFRETNIDSLQKIYRNYAGIIPSFELFKSLMQKYTDNFGALYIQNDAQSNDWRECVYSVRLDIDQVNESFTFGSDEFKSFSKKRFDEQYESRAPEEFEKYNEFVENYGK